MDETYINVAAALEFLERSIKLHDMHASCQ
jgi:hypothetical protein